MLLSCWGQERGRERKGRGACFLELSLVKEEVNKLVVGRAFLVESKQVAWE